MTYPAKIIIDCEILLPLTTIQEIASVRALDILSTYQVQDINGRKLDNYFDVQLCGTREDLERFYEETRDSLVVLDETFDEWLAYSISVINSKDFSNLLNRMSRFVLKNKRCSVEQSKWIQIHEHLNAIIDICVE